MRKVLLFSILLLAGLAGSQWLPDVVGPGYAKVGDTIRILTMTGLSFIMIRVGYEFDIDKSRLGRYGWDYVVAFTAASFPWILVTLYLVFVMLPSAAWGDLAAWQETSERCSPRSATGTRLTGGSDSPSPSGCGLAARSAPGSW